MALGAFASKTVACLLDTLQLNASYALGKLTFETVDGHTMANGLGKAIYGYLAILLLHIGFTVIIRKIF